MINDEQAVNRPSQTTRSREILKDGNDTEVEYVVRYEVPEINQIQHKSN